MDNHGKESRLDADEPDGGAKSDAASNSTETENSDRKSRKNRTRADNPNDNKFGRDHQNRESLMNLEDQFETSKLVLQLVTDSRFNMTQINGQRKLGGPPPGWKGPPPGPGCEVFVGKIPRTLYEHEIYPIFRRMGEVYEIRLMMDFSGTNRGYCFIMFGRPEFAQKAIRELNNFEIRPGRRIGVVASVNNCRLYVGQLPPDISSETVIRKIYEITDDVGQVAVYRNVSGQARYALISYKTHRGAAMARRRLVPERASLFGGAEVSIDWAHPGMFPSNVVEESGISDEQGNIEMFRVIVGNENRRYQTRRRVRDELLDSSIQSYIESDRALESYVAGAPRGRQHASQQRAADCSFNGASEGKVSSAAGQGHRQGRSRAVKQRGRNSAIDLVANQRGSSSSGSSASSSRSDHGIVNSALNNLFAGCPEGLKKSENRVNNRGESEDMKTGDCFNLFENYRFSSPTDILFGNSADSSNGSVKNMSEFPGCYSPRIDNDSIEEVFSPDERQNFRQPRIQENDSAAFAVDNFFKNGGLETFSKPAGAIPKGKPPRSYSAISNGVKTTADRPPKTGGKTGQQNLNHHFSKQNQNLREAVNRGLQPAENFANLQSVANHETPGFLNPQNRNGNCPVISSKNNKIAKGGAALNPRNTAQKNGYHNISNCLDVNANARRALLELNGCLLSQDNAAVGASVPNFCNLSQDLLGFKFPSTFASQMQIFEANDQFLNVNANGFGPVKNFVDITQANNRFRIAQPEFQNRKSSTGKNGQKIGRPILNRSQASFCKEN